MRHREKRKEVFLWLCNQKVDIVLLQETFWTKDLEPVIRAEWKDLCYFDHGTNHSKGVAILINSNVLTDVKDVTAKGDGRALFLKVRAGECLYCIVNVYAPTKASDKDRFYKNLFWWIRTLDISKSELVFGGDWNCVQNPQLDTQGVSFPYKQKKWFSKLIKKYNLIDIWRIIHQNKKQFTWRQISLGLFSRLDYWLISSTLQYAVQNTDIRPAIRCDHNAISLKIKTSGNVRGRQVLENE